MNLRPTLLAFALAFTVAAPSFAQMGDMKMPAAAPGTQGDPVQIYDAALSGLESEFMGAAKAMPADKYNFTPASLNIPGAKYSDVKTFVQEVTHVAQANYYYFAAAAGSKPSVDVKAIGNITPKDEAVQALAASFAFGHKAVAALTAANSAEVVKGMPMTTRASAVSFGIAHAFDHYGQMVEYLRMNGIVPPASAK